MSDNHDSIFAGLQACNPRDLCAALSSWQHGESADFDMFVRAVTSLALTVEEQRIELARLNASLAAVARVAEQHALDHARHETTDSSPMGLIDRYATYATNPLGLIDRFDRHNEAGPRAMLCIDPADEPSPEGAAWLAQKNRLELVYLGLVDVWRMARPVVNDQREDIGNITRLHERTTALVAIEARLRAMLEAAGKLPPN